MTDDNSGLTEKILKTPGAQLLTQYVVAAPLNCCLINGGHCTCRLIHITPQKKGALSALLIFSVMEGSIPFKLNEA